MSYLNKETGMIEGEMPSREPMTEFDLGESIIQSKPILKRVKDTAVWFKKNPNKFHPDIKYFEDDDDHYFNNIVAPQVGGVINRGK